MAKRKTERPPEKPTVTCRKCIHEWACSMQCGGNVMAEANATRCACYEDVKSSAAYLIGRLDGAGEQRPHSGWERLSGGARYDKTTDLRCRRCGGVLFDIFYPEDRYIGCPFCLAVMDE